VPARCLYSKTTTGQALFGHEKTLRLIRNILSNIFQETHAIYMPFRHLMNSKVSRTCSLSKLERGRERLSSKSQPNYHGLCNDSEVFWNRL